MGLCQLTLRSLRCARRNINHKVTPSERGGGVGCRTGAWICLGSQLSWCCESLGRQGEAVRATALRMWARGLLLLGRPRAAGPELREGWIGGPFCQQAN